MASTNSDSATAPGYRWAAIAGITSMVLLLISNFLAPAAPGRGSTADEITKYYVSHHTALLLGGYFGGASMLLFFLAGLRSWLASAEDEPSVLSSGAYTAGVVFASLALISLAATTTAVFKVAKLGDPALIRALYDLHHNVLHLIWFPTAALIGGSALVAMRTRIFPAWLSWASLAIAVVVLIAAGGLFADKSNVVTALSFLGFLLFVVWVAAVSLMLPRAPSGGT
jgi:hypothetical protein